MLRTRRTPKDRAAFPTELPSGLRIPAGVSPETYASHRDVLSVLLLRFMTSRLRAMYQAYDGDLTLCLVLGEIASRNTERFYDERRGYQPASFNGQRQYLPCNAFQFRTLPVSRVKPFAVSSPSSLTWAGLKRLLTTCTSSPTASAPSLPPLTTARLTI